MSTKLWKLNAKAVKLLRKAKRAILAKPSSYRQDRWHCGTACCLAGHIAIAAGAKAVKISTPWCQEVVPQIRDFTGRSDYDWKVIAEREMGLSSSQTTYLFDGNPSFSWPKPFSTDWKKARTREARALVAARRIEHFIETGK